MIEFGAAFRPLPGESECGDQYLVRPLAHGHLLAVADGVGHGQPAAAAANLALDQLRQETSPSPIAWMRRCHERLQGTRGAVLSLAFFDPHEMTLTWLGVGNVQGLLRHADDRLAPSPEFLLLRPGVVGLHLPRLQAAIVPVSPGDLLIFATDGLREAFDYRLEHGPSVNAAAERILNARWRGTDDALVLVARFEACPPR
ncbi:MAG TPA: SpoIIE family protein phosphatase [Terriglobales bacterium]|nr:SpoIIE family protein phosphatase [Terriglobales bacterium]